jgi:hypothetical protein
MALTMAIVGYWILSRAQRDLHDNHPPSDEQQPSRFERLKGKLEFSKRRPFKMEKSV